MQQVFGLDPRRRVSDEQSQQPVGQQIAQQHQPTGEPEVDRQPRAQDRPQALQASGTDGLGAEDRGGDGNRQRRKLHIVDDLRHRAVGRRGLGTVAIDQREDHQLRQRDHHHLQPCGQANAQHFAEDVLSRRIAANNARSGARACSRRFRRHASISIADVVPTSPAHAAL